MQIDPVQGQRLLHGDKKSVNNQITNYPLQSNRSESRDDIESTSKGEKCKQSQDFRTSVNNDESVENNVSHEIVKNVENNLLYTVLGTKKQSSIKTLHSDKLTDAHYVKVCTNFCIRTA